MLPSNRKDIGCFRRIPLVCSSEHFRQNTVLFSIVDFGMFEEHVH